MRDGWLRRARQVLHLLHVQFVRARRLHLGEVQRVAAVSGQAAGFIVPVAFQLGLATGEVGCQGRIDDDGDVVPGRARCHRPLAVAVNDVFQFIQ